MTPALSVVLVSDSYETASRVVECVLEQSVRERIELVLVLPRGQETAVPVLEGLAGVLQVLVETLAPLGEARAAGVASASAPVVYLAETHAYPCAGCAEALIAAHEEPWTAVVPEIANANPVGALSWAGFLLDYGSWHDGGRRRVARPPAYNFSFRPDLFPRGRQLAELLEPGGDLAGALGPEAQFLYEPAARIEHLNVSRPRAWLQERFLVGRLVATRRAARWSRARRAVYCGGSPLLPALLLFRARRAVFAAARRHRLPALAYPALALGASVWALGELIGYAAGTSERTESAIVEYELHKTAYASDER